jgi:hypothetical protein
VKPVMVFKSEFDPIERAGNLAEQMVRYLLPGAPLSKSIYSIDMWSIDGLYDQLVNAF